MPLLTLLHGAGGEAAAMVELVKPQADRHAVAVLAPSSSSRRSWDLISSRSYGPDVAGLDQSLRTALGLLHEEVDSTRLAIGGFSDGASYALSLGLINGDALFTHVIAFSPGFMRPTRRGDRPSIFMSHGVHDRVLPIDSCSRRLAPSLSDAGYPVKYTEFNGGHVVPAHVLDEAFSWMMGGPQGS